MPFTVPAASQGEPEVSVPVSVIADAAELAALVAELVDTAPGGAVRAEIEALMGRKGAEPGPAADWMIAAAGALARQAEEILACEGIACDRGLARYWRRPGTRRQGG
jgi:hypothetical protein